MFRVVSVVDKTGTAIDRLAKGLSPYMNGIDYQVVDVHPKRPDPSQIERFETLAKTADIIDYQYFRTAEMLRKRYEWLKDIPSLLTHHNPYSITESDWNGYDIVIANNKTIQKDLSQITRSRLELIPNAINPYFWKFNEEYTHDKSVIMVANRIEGKKGILPVAKACKEIGFKLKLVGAISDMDYFHEVNSTGVVEFSQEITDEQLRDTYYSSGIHVCNSVDNFESGTLPMLEAIYCGVPVLTRNIGQVPDIKDEDNLVIQDSDPEDVSRIADLLLQMHSDKKKLEDMRHEAWFTVKDRNYERRAYQYKRLYRTLIGGESVSIIMPVADKPETTRQTLEAAISQNHKNLEVIVVDDGETSQIETVESIRKLSNVPVSYYKTDLQGYNLAHARNIGIIESTSDVIVFCDQRMKMQEDTVSEFLRYLQPKHWLYGNKGAKKEFVENLSCVYRSEIVGMGMFNQEITQYGGMSQECRARARAQNIILKYIETAKATPIGKSSNRRRKKMEILESKNMLWKVGLS